MQKHLQLKMFTMLSSKIPFNARHFIWEQWESNNFAQVTFHCLGYW